MLPGNHLVAALSDRVVNLEETQRFAFNLQLLLFLSVVLVLELKVFNYGNGHIQLSGLHHPQLFKFDRFLFLLNVDGPPTVRHQLAFLLDEAQRPTLVSERR